MTRLSHLSGSIPAGQARGRSGFTIVELLVCIAVIGLLVALLLPAVQMSRESARQSQCRNNLKQLSLAVFSFESSYQVLPSDGWGYEWIGEPNQGVGVNQPGGWIYQILPYIERNDLRQMGAGLPDPLRQIALGNLSQMGTSVTRCPSRPATDQCPRNPQLVWFNAELLPTVSRSDYAGNAGDFFYGISTGPGSLTQGQSSSYGWPDTSFVTGVFYLRSSVRMAALLDGASNTYLIGEKCVAIPCYATFCDFGYDQSISSGDDWDLVRWTDDPPHPDSQEVLSKRFGSAHNSVFHMALCDGSVRAVNFGVEARVHKQLGNRKDGGPAGADF